MLDRLLFWLRMKFIALLDLWFDEDLIEDDREHRRNQQEKRRCF